MSAQTLHERLLSIGFEYIELYENGKFKLEMLASLPSVRHTFLLVYGRMVKGGEMEPIEAMPQEVKNQLWALCKPYTAGLTAGECREFAKCYAALDKLAAIKEVN
jgi:hypothetical protein